jgi:hypothetical protein
VKEKKSLLKDVVYVSKQAARPPAEWTLDSGNAVIPSIAILFSLPLYTFLICFFFFCCMYHLNSICILSSHLQHLHIPCTRVKKKIPFLVDPSFLRCCVYPWLFLNISRLSFIQLACRNRYRNTRIYPFLSLY